jgi:hypothetical protein
MPTIEAKNSRFRMEAAYFNCVEIEENVELSFVPSPFTTLMMAMEMPAAIKPYSMAVAAFSSFKNLMTKRMSGGIPVKVTCNAPIPKILLGD